MLSNNKKKKKKKKKRKEKKKKEKRLQNDILNHHVSSTSSNIHVFAYNIWPLKFWLQTFNYVALLLIPSDMPMFSIIIILSLFFYFIKFIYCYWFVLFAGLAILVIICHVNKKCVVVDIAYHKR